MAWPRLIPAILFGATIAPIAMITPSGLGAGQIADLSSLSNADLKTVTVRFERTGCFGNCPEYALTIHGDGRVEYAGRSYVKKKGTREGRVDSATVRKLMAEFDRAKFLLLGEDYSTQEHCCGQCTDLPTAITALSALGTVHQVRHYYGCGCAPDELVELESAIDRVINSRRWTGDVSKQGPDGTYCPSGLTVCSPPP